MVMLSIISKSEILRRLTPDCVLCIDMARCTYVWTVDCGYTVMVIRATRDQFLPVKSPHMLLSAHATCQALPVSQSILIIPWAGSVQTTEGRTHIS